MMEPSHTYGSDINTGLRKALDENIEAAFQSKRRIAQGKDVASRYRKGNELLFPTAETIARKLIEKSC